MNLEVSQGSIADLGQDWVVVSKSAATTNGWQLGDKVTVGAAYETAGSSVPGQGRHASGRASGSELRWGSVRRGTVPHLMLMADAERGRDAATLPRSPCDDRPYCLRVLQDPLARELVGRANHAVARVGARAALVVTVEPFNLPD
jgi:hypothetical protein